MDYLFIILLILLIIVAFCICYFYNKNVIKLFIGGSDGELDFSKEKIVKTDENDLEFIVNSINSYMNLLNKNKITRINDVRTRELSENFLSYVYYLGNVPLGFISSEALPNIHSISKFKIHYLFVVDEFRNKGIGTKLMKYMLDKIYSTTDKTMEVELDVSKKNVNYPKLLKFYDGFQFHISAETNNSYKMSTFPKFYTRILGPDSDRAILFIPGLNDHNTWIMQESLSKVIQTVSFDPPKFGYSYNMEIPDDYYDYCELIHRNVVSELKRDKNIIIVACSIGCSIAMLYDKIYPGNILKLILINPILNVDQLNTLRNINIPEIIKSTQNINEKIINQYIDIFIKNINQVPKQIPNDKIIIHYSVDNKINNVKFEKELLKLYKNVIRYEDVSYDIQIVESDKIIDNIESNIVGFPRYTH